MARKKNNKPKPVVKLLPENYIKTKAQSLPLYECLINPDWQESGLATILVARQQPSENLILGVFLVDIFCLGLKNTNYFFNETTFSYENNLKDIIYSSQDYEPCDYVLAHNIIYGAIEYAEGFGFKPNRDFSITKFILDKDEEVEVIKDIEFGKDGKPFYIIGPYDNVTYITNRLLAVAGEGNFTVIDPQDEDDDFFDDLEDDDEDDENTENELDEFEAFGKEVPNIQLKSYQISYEPMGNLPYKKYTTILGEDKVQELHDMAINKPKKAIPILKELIAMYPEFSMLYNYLSVALIKAGKEDESVPVMAEMYEKFPDYLFAKVNYARHFLTKGEPEKVAEIFDNKFDLKELYPDRDVFHISEAMGFFSLMASYYIELNQLEQAETYLDILKKLDKNHPVTKEIATRLDFASLQDSLKRVLNKAKSLGIKKKNKKK